MQKTRRWLGWEDISLVIDCHSKAAVHEFMADLATRTDLSLEAREDGSWRIVPKKRKKHEVGNLFG